MATKKSRMTAEGWRRSLLTARALQLNLEALHLAHGDQVDLVLAQRSVGGFISHVEATIAELQAEKMPAAAPVEDALPMPAGYEL
jgi:predicted lipoprotein